MTIVRIFGREIVSPKPSIIFNFCHRGIERSVQGPDSVSVSLTLSLFFLTFIKQTRLFSGSEREGGGGRGGGRSGLACFPLPRSAAGGSLLRPMSWRGGGGKQVWNCRPPSPLVFFLWFCFAEHLSQSLFRHIVPFSLFPLLFPISIDMGRKEQINSEKQVWSWIAVKTSAAPLSCWL